MTTIAILGANGRIGNAAARSFHSAGFIVIAVTRDGIAPGLPAAIERRAANALDQQTLIAATEGADFIFNGLNCPYPDWHKSAIPMAQNVIAAAKTAKAVHLFPGNLYNFGKKIPEMASEKTPFIPSTKKGRIRIEMEKLYETAAKQEGIKTLILRAGDYFGGSIGGAWFDLVITAKLGKGVFTYPGPTNIAHAWAYLPDFANAFVILASNADKTETFESFNFAGHPLTGEDIQALITNAIGHPLKRAGMPWSLLRLVSPFNRMVHEICEMSYLWFTPHSLDGRKWKARFEPFPRTGCDKAISQALIDLDIEPASRKSA